MSNTYKYFTRDEFACKCGQCGLNEISEELIQKLDQARDMAGVPFVVNSGYRCPEHNRAVGGVDSSSHLSGLAVDIATPDSRTRYKALEALLAHFNRVGVAKTFIHVDIDPEKTEEVVWVY